MIRKHFLKLFFAALFVVTPLLTLRPSSGTENSAQNSPRFIVHLMDYLAQDYAGAVQGGKVVSQSEYAEQVEFGKTAVETNKNIEETKGHPEIQKDLEALFALIQSKADATKVADLARKIQNAVIQVTHLEMAPTEWPNIKRGRELFAQNCIACHGPGGNGDGLAGKGLDPKPANFHDPERMPNLSPFQAFNAIRLGIPGTGMAPYKMLADKDIWSLSFYILSLRHEEFAPAIENGLNFNKETLIQAATQTDTQLETRFTKPQVHALRLHLPKEDQQRFLQLARSNLAQAGLDYQGGNIESAKKKSLIAYLEGIEPLEPRLRANDSAFTVELEEKMGRVRSAIDGRKTITEVLASISEAQAALNKAEVLMHEKHNSAGLTFVVASGILLREGFEAVLILIALLGVIRASGARRAARWVHGGWIAAIGIGFVAWFFSGWLMELSGAGRELMEGLVSCFAVLVLLYIGFWLHSRTEIHRWKEFIDGRVKAALDGGNLWGLFAIAFIAVFREVFETVLFLRAIWLEGGADNAPALAAGVFGSLAAILVLAWLLLKYSARIPIRKLFDVSSTLMVLLAVILSGKGLHSLQESGLVSITSLPFSLRVDLIGFYPTYETALAQLVVLLVSVSLWFYGKRPTRRQLLPT